MPEHLDALTTISRDIYVLLSRGMKANVIYWLRRKSLYFFPKHLIDIWLLFRLELHKLTITEVNAREAKMFCLFLNLFHSYKLR